MRDVSGASLARLTACGLVLIGIGIRADGLTAPPLDFHPTRQYRAALVARDYFYDGHRAIAAQDRQLARATAAGLSPLEPPVVEHLAAWLYRLHGAEQLWLARALSLMAWVAGGVCLAWLAWRLYSTAAALVALTAHLLMPYGVEASRSFQPDPLMVLGLLASLCALVAHDHRPGWGRWAAAAVLMASTVLVKPMAVFFLLPPAIALHARAAGWRATLGSRRLALLSAVTVAPALAYYYATWYVPGIWTASSQGRVLPALLLTPELWTGWARMAAAVCAPVLLAAAAAGVAFGRPGRGRALLAGLWLGYLGLGLTFTYHIQTHDYYSLPLIPVAALSLASLTDAALGRIGWRADAAWLHAALAVTALAVGAATWVSTRQLDAEWPATLAKYAAIGRHVQHSDRTVIIDGSYGLPLAYHGGLAGSPWPLSIDMAVSRLTGTHAALPAAQRLARYPHADYFVVTDMAELYAQPDLLELLSQSYPTVAVEGGAPDGYAIYDLRRSTLAFDATRVNFTVAGDGSAVTPARDVRILGASSAAWRVDSTRPDVFVLDPTEGQGRSHLRVGVRRTASPPPRPISALVTLDTRGGTAPPLELRLTVRPAGEGRAPFGVVDLPTDPTLPDDGPLLLAGWALDDLELTRVVVRAAPQGAAAERLLGHATLGLARPDVAVAYPDTPAHSTAGWHYRVEPAALAGLTRPLELRVYADDADGETSLLGTRRVCPRSGCP